MSASSKPGTVYLVGAGPGDPGLLTLRAAELLASVKVVAYDDLVGPAILEKAHPEALLLPVGRRKGHGKTEYRLHPDVLVHAKAGRDVLRLKAGDPLVFGRGGEEAQDLVEAGVPFEIVPGITAALGAASRAGIPLTHREVSSSLTLTTGHFSEGENPNREGTVALYMAAHDLDRNLGDLVRAGRSPSTPAAYISAATTPAQEVIVGTLGDLAKKVGGTLSPALVIVGEVVRLREWADWVSRRPLSGWRIAVARARPGVSRLAESLRAKGADVLEIPFVRAAALERAPAFGSLESYDGIVFPSPDAVEAFLEHAGADLRDLPKRPWIAVGKPAEERLKALGIRPLSTEGDCVDALGSVFVPFKGKRLLVLVPEGGRTGLLGDLENLGIRCDAVPAYRHLIRHPKVVAPPPRLIALPSSTAARLLLEGPFGKDLMDVPMIAIGPRTEAAARACGATKVERAPEDSVEAVVAAVLARA